MTDRPYPARHQPLPRSLEEVTPEWLTSVLQHKYPSVEIVGWDVVELINSHTTKIRLKLDMNEAGREADLPDRLCLKGNWSDVVMGTSDPHVQEARFYHHFRDILAGSLPRKPISRTGTPPLPIRASC